MSSETADRVIRVISGHIPRDRASGPGFIEALALYIAEQPENSAALRESYIAGILGEQPDDAAIKVVARAMVRKKARWHAGVRDEIRARLATEESRHATAKELVERIERIRATGNAGHFREGHKESQKGDEPRTAFIQMRVTQAQKSAFVSAADRVQGRSLTDWLIEAGEEKIERDQDENARQKRQCETGDEAERT